MRIYWMRRLGMDYRRLWRVKRTRYVNSGEVK